MNEIISFNTEDAVKHGTEMREIEIFSLVDESDSILNQIVPTFDFENPPVDPTTFASQMVETCKVKGGFGLSANQCGFDYRVFVMGADDEYVAMFNPLVLSTSVNESLVAEGCLSFPMLALKISRPEEVVVQYQDYNGETHTTELHGLSAHVVQHEIDHLNGITFIERAKPMSLKMGLKKRGKFTKLIERYAVAQKRLNEV
jgi:peptide deformylase